MKKKVLGIFLLLSLVLITGCGRKSIVGKWKSVDTKTEYYYIFNKDNTCSYEMLVARLDCTYKVDHEKVTISYKGTDKENIYNYHFDGNTLVITDMAGKDNKFVKSK